MLVFWIDVVIGIVAFFIMIKIYDFINNTPIFHFLSSIGDDGTNS